MPEYPIATEIKAVRNRDYTRLRVYPQAWISFQKPNSQAKDLPQICLVIGDYHPVIHVPSIVTHPKVILHVVVKPIQIKSGIQLAGERSDTKPYFGSICIDELITKPQNIGILNSFPDLLLQILMTD